MESLTKKYEKNFDRCMAYLHNSEILLNDKQLAHLINDFDNDPLAIKVLISYLEYWHNNQIKGLEHIPVLHNKNQIQAYGLKRLLMAYERQFQDCAEITLLYLLSLSNNPISQRRIKRVFHRTFIQKILLWDSDYQKFLTPLSQLNKQGWNKVIKTLHSLNLLHLYDSNGERVLYIEQRICQHFRESLATHKWSIFQYVCEDMKLVSGEIVANNLPKTSVRIPAPNYGLPRKTANTTTPSNSEQHAYRPTASSDAHSQLRALRRSLKVLQAQLQELNNLELSACKAQHIVENSKNRS